MRRTRIILTILTIAAVSVILPVGFFCFQGITISIEAEKTLHANRLVIEVLIAYLREHPGQWPKKWEELERTTIDPKVQAPMFHWPENITEIRHRVDVDFDLTLPEVAAMEVENFKAVQPKGPNYGPWENSIIELLDVARQAPRILKDSVER